ncbi:MAG: RNA polymerase subunit sigma [Lachnospiraceae bacterium]|nr:RNA polymerase subunit sigma [Lachnospiraceae bacterium]
MDDLSVRAIAAKEDENIFYRLAQDNRGFIKRCAFRACRRFVSESDDEWSIALIAFYEAVRSYDEAKGPFKGFASMVIRRRLMDYFDSQSRHQAEVPANPYSFDGQIESDQATALDIEISKSNALVDESMNPGSSSLEDEIEEIRQVIAPYGFDLYEVGGCSPKALKTKRACASVIKVLSVSDELFAIMRKKRNLPFMKLLDIPGVNKKLLERHRKFLIIAAEICRGDFPQLAEYIVKLGES